MNKNLNLEKQNKLTIHLYLFNQMKDMMGTIQIVLDSNLLSMHHYYFDLRRLF